MNITTIDLCFPENIGNHANDRLNNAIERLFPLDVEMGIIPAHIAIVEYWRWTKHREECERQLYDLADGQSDSEYYANADDEPLGVTLRDGGFRVVYEVGERRVVSFVGVIDEADQAFADALHEATVRGAGDRRPERKRTE